MAALLWLTAVFTTSIVLTNGFMITDFTQISSGESLKAEWDKLDPTFANLPLRAVYGGGKIFALVQRRVLNVTDPPGGIVSIFDLSQNKWTSHTKHDLNVGNLEHRIFTLDSRLHMLGFVRTQTFTEFREFIYVWDEELASWTTVPMIATDKIFQTNRMLDIYVSVPDQSGSIAYVAASVNTLIRNYSGMILTLKIEVQDGKTINAKLEFQTEIYEKTNDQANAMREVQFVARGKNDNDLRGFCRQNYRTAGPFGTDYWRVHLMIMMNLTIKTFDSLYINNGPTLNLVNRNDRVFQMQDRVIFIGSESFGRGGSVPKIWIYNLNTFDLQDRRASIPDDALAINQDTSKLFAVEWDKVSVATLIFEEEDDIIILDRKLGAQFS